MLTHAFMLILDFYEHKTGNSKIIGIDNKLFFPN